MLKVGITGGMGSGKTTVCKIFETLGIPVYHADDRAKYLMTHDKMLIKKIKSIFGEKAYRTDLQLNRKHISNIAFQDPEKLKELNKAVHPVVIKDSEQWHNSQENAPYTLKEAALLFESGGNKKLDKIITIVAPLEIRIKRILERDQTTKEDVMARIKNQLSDEEKVAKSDYVIHNDTKKGLIQQVLEIHSELTKR